MPVRPVRLIVSAVWLFAVLLAGSVHAQPEPGKPAPASVPDAQGEVTIQVVQLGLGGSPRSGEWAGIQLVLSDRSPTPRDLAVRLILKDSDGDQPVYQRVIASTPGTRQSVWLYAMMPSDLTDGELLTFRVYAAESAPGKVESAGEILGEARVPVQSLIPMVKGAIAVVGTPPVGLPLYGTFDASMGLALPMGHEVQQLLSQLTPAQLPDRWMGLSGISTLVWTAAGSEGEPSQLSEPQAQALREWIARGGHLVIVLPTVGQQWLAPANPLADLMPRVRANRREGVDYAEYQRILRRDPAPGEPAAVYPTQAIAHTFEPLDEGAIRILTGPRDQQAVVVRRLFGAGAVTIIGLDVRNPALAIRGGLQPDIFWHRVLGGRGDLISTADASAMTNRVSNRRFFGRREEVRLDAGIPGQINKEGAAAAGLLLAFVVFLTYWAVAGPVGFGLLRVRKRTGWAWVAFVGATAGFTVLAWGAASVLKPRTVDAKHLTVLGHVYGQPIQRARAWMSVLLPRYGAMDVAVTADPTGSPASGFHDTLCAWAPPPDMLSSSSEFNNTRPYVVSAREPREAVFPSRSTVKTVRVDWAGGPRWKMPVPVSAEEAPKLTPVPTRGQRPWALSGKLVHEMPGALLDADLILVRGQFQLSRPQEGQLLAEASAWSIGRWDPSSPLDLAEATAAKPGGSAAESLTKLLDDRLQFAPDRSGARGFGAGDLARRFTALALFGLLTPPITDDRAQTNAQPLFQRESFQGWDLTRWITQPCIIIIGQVADSPSPVPMTVDGEPLPTSGRTVVWWVYPLPEDPPKPPTLDAPNPP